MNKPEVSDERRRAPRRPVLWNGKLLVGKHRFDCRILDISLTGARLQIDLPLKRGAEVGLSIPRCEELPAAVSFQRDDRLGLSFTIPPDEVADKVGEAAAHTLGLDRGRGGAA